MVVAPVTIVRLAVIPRSRCAEGIAQTHGVTYSYNTVTPLVLKLYIDELADVHSPVCSSGDGA